MPAVCILLLALLLAIVPAEAFTADALTIGLSENGDAQIDFEYTLSFLEKVAVFLKIGDPNEELKKALENNMHLPVSVEEVTDSSARFMVSGFATRKEGKNSFSLQTPPLSFAKAEEVLNQYWFASLIQPDFSPGTTTITYPDGYTKTYTDKISIPKTSHTVKT